MGKATAAFNHLSKLWSGKKLSLELKLGNEKYVVTARDSYEGFSLEKSI